MKRVGTVNRRSQIDSKLQKKFAEYFPATINNDGVDRPWIPVK